MSNEKTAGRWGDVNSDPLARQEHMLSENPQRRLRSMFSVSPTEIGGLSIEKQPADLDHFRGHRNVSTGLAYNIRGRATRLEAEVGDALATFQDPIKALYGTRICEGQHVTITRKFVVGGKAVPTPERAPARVVRVQEDIRHVSLTRYGADMEMNLNLFLRPGDAEHEMAMKLNAQKRSLENELIKMGYQSIMENAICLQDAIVRSKPNNGDMDTMRRHAEYVFATSVFGALSRFEFPLQNLVAAAKNASAYRNVVGPGSLMILPHAIPDMLAYTKPYHMEYSITGVSTKDKKPVSMPLESVYHEPMLNMKIMVHHPPAENAWGDVQKRRGDSELTKERHVYGYVPCQTGDSMHDNRPLAHFEQWHKMVPTPDLHAIRTLLGQIDCMYENDPDCDKVGGESAEDTVPEETEKAQLQVAVKTAKERLQVFYDILLRLPGPSNKRKQVPDDFQNVLMALTEYATFEDLEQGKKGEGEEKFDDDNDGEERDDLINIIGSAVQDMTDAPKEGAWPQPTPHDVLQGIFRVLFRNGGIAQEKDSNDMSYEEALNDLQKTLAEEYENIVGALQAGNNGKIQKDTIWHAALEAYEKLVALITTFKEKMRGLVEEDTLSQFAGKGYVSNFEEWPRDFFDAIKKLLHDYDRFMGGNPVGATNGDRTVDTLYTDLLRIIKVPDPPARCGIYHPILHPTVGSSPVDLHKMGELLGVNMKHTRTPAASAYFGRENNGLYYDVDDLTRLKGILKHATNAMPDSTKYGRSRVTEFNQKQPTPTVDNFACMTGYALRKVTFYMSSALIGVPGNETGELLVGYPMTNVSTNQRTESLTVGLRVYLGAVLKQVENVIVIPDVAFEGCKADVYLTDEQRMEHAASGDKDGCFSHDREKYIQQLTTVMQKSATMPVNVLVPLNEFMAKAGDMRGSYLSQGMPIPSTDNRKPYYENPPDTLPVFSHTTNGTFCKGTTILAELDADDKVTLTSGLQVYRRR